MKWKMEFRFVAAIAALVFNGTLLAAVVPIDLSSWSVVEYEFGQIDANWLLSNNNTVATQTNNANASILLGDFDISNKEIRGTWRVDTTGDDDLMGFVFGYQNRSQFYLFDWKQFDQNHPWGFAEQGMSLKLVDIPGGADPLGTDLWPTAGSTNVSVLAHNTVQWEDLTDYEFVLNFSPGLFEITVSDGGAVVENWVIADNSYTSGNFGFYNLSQPGVLYSGFAQENVIPIPPAVWLFGSGLLGLAGIARRKRT